MPLTNEDLEPLYAFFRQVEERLNAKLDRGTEALTANLSELRTELKIRMDTLENRFTNQLGILITVDQRTAAMVRANDRLETQSGALALTQAAQQRAFDELAARVKAIEDRLNQQQG